MTPTKGGIALVTVQYSCLIQWWNMQTVQSLIRSKGKLVKQVVWNCFVIQIKFVCNNTACWEIPGILYCSVLHFANLLGAPQMWTSFKSSWQKSSKLTRCILITKQMCFRKRGNYSGGKNRKYFFGKRKILELWTKNEKCWSKKKFQWKRIRRSVCDIRREDDQCGSLIGW